MRLLETLFDIICPEQTRMNIKKENERLHSSRKSARENQKDLNKVFPNAPHAPSYFNAQEFINKLQETDKMSAYIYICNNTPGGALDYKLSGTRTKNSIEFENWGNYFFGATSESRGWNDQVSLYGAGAIQLLTGRFDSNNCNTKYHCDQPKDQKKIRSGQSDVKDYIKMNEWRQRIIKQLKGIKANSIENDRIETPGNDKIA